MNTQQRTALRRIAGDLRLVKTLIVGKRDSDHKLAQDKLSQCASLIEKLVQFDRSDGSAVVGVYTRRSL
jgi:hypothetical protein